MLKNASSVGYLKLLLGRIAARRRPREVRHGQLEWIVGDPTVCPFRFSFWVDAFGLVTLVIFDAQWRRLLPAPGKGRALGFVPDQVDQMWEVFDTARRRITETGL